MTRAQILHRYSQLKRALFHVCGMRLQPRISFATATGIGTRSANMTIDELTKRSIAVNRQIAVDKAEAASIQRDLAELQQSKAATRRIADWLKCQESEVPEVVASVLDILKGIYATCGGCDKFIITGEVWSIPDPGHNGDDGSSAPSVPACADCLESHSPRCYEPYETYAERQRDLAKSFILEIHAACDRDDVAVVRNLLEELKVLMVNEGDADV